MVLKSVPTLVTPPFERSLSARRRVWPTQRIRFCWSSPCTVGKCSSFSKSVFLVRSILVCFESVFIRVALGVQSDFVMRVYIPSRSVVSSFMRGHTSALYNIMLSTRAENSLPFSFQIIVWLFQMQSRFPNTVYAIAARRQISP